MAGQTNWAGDIGTGASAGGLIGGPIGAGVGALAGLGLAGFEYFNNKKDNAAAAAARPQYTIPPEIAQNLTAAQQQALQGMPAEQQQQYINNLQQGAAYSLQQIGTRQGGLAGVAEANQALNQGYGNLAAQSSAIRQGNLDKLSAARQGVANYKDQAFQLNQLDPYNINTAKQSANTGALYQNLSQGLQLGSQALGLYNKQQNQGFNTSVNLPSANQQFQNDLSNAPNVNPDILGLSTGF